MVDVCDIHWLDQDSRLWYSALDKPYRFGSAGLPRWMLDNGCFFGLFEGRALYHPGFCGYPRQRPLPPFGGRDAPYGSGVRDWGGIAFRFDRV